MDTSRLHRSFINIMEKDKLSQTGRTNEAISIENQFVKWNSEIGKLFYMKKFSAFESQRENFIPCYQSSN